MAHAIVQQGEEGGFAVTFFKNPNQRPVLFVETKWNKVAKKLKEAFENEAQAVNEVPATSGEGSLQASL